MREVEKGFEALRLLLADEIPYEEFQHRMNDLKPLRLFEDVPGFQERRRCSQCLTDSKHGRGGHVRPNMAG